MKRGDMSPIRLDTNWEIYALLRYRRGAPPAASLLHPESEEVGVVFCRTPSQ